MGSSDGGSKRNGNHFQDHSTVLCCMNVLVLFLLFNLASVFKSFTFQLH